MIPECNGQGARLEGGRYKTLMAEQELLEIVVVAGHGERELGAIQVFGEARGERRSNANSLLYDFRKFGGMRRGQNQSLRGSGCCLR